MRQGSERSLARPRLGFSAATSPAASSAPSFSRTRTLVTSGVSIDAPKAAVPPLKVGHGLIEMPASEIGPQGVGDPELRVCHLPQQKVRQAHLAARADQE